MLGAAKHIYMVASLQQFCLYPYPWPGRRNVLLRRVSLSSTQHVPVLGPAFWLDGIPPEFEAVSKHRGLVPLASMDATTRQDIAELGNTRELPCDTGTKCEACMGSCQPLVPIMGSPGRNQRTGCDIDGRATQAFIERSRYTVPDSQSEVLLYRQAKTLKYFCFSMRGSPTTKWSEPAPSGIPDSTSNMNAGVLPDGRVFVLSNPSTRETLVISLSHDGFNFSRAFDVASCHRAPFSDPDPPTSQPDGCKRRNTASGHGAVAYPQAVIVVELGAMFITVSNSVEDIWVLRVPLASLTDDVLETPAVKTDDDNEAVVAVDFQRPQRSLKVGRSGLYNVVRHRSFWGKALAPLDPSYAPSFSRMGTQHVCIFLRDEMDELSPSSGVLNFTKLQLEIDDMIAMGFLPCLRFANPPSWIVPPDAADPTHHVKDQIAVLKSAPVRARFLVVIQAIVQHLADKYGARIHKWAFSCGNEIGMYTPALSGGNWDTGSQFLATMYSEFATAIKSVDPALRPSGGLEATTPYELFYFVEFLNRTDQLWLLDNASFLDFHHYGDYGNLTENLDATLDNAKISTTDITITRQVLDESGLEHIELWESERAFNADGWEYVSKTMNVALN